MVKWILSFLFIFQSVWTVNFQDQSQDIYSFEWNHPEDFKKAQKVFLKSFLFTYESISLKQLGVTNKEGFLKNTIEEEYSLVSENDHIHWLIAKMKNKVVGLMIIELTDYPHLVYVRQIAIHPDLMRKRIGTQMVQVMFSNLPKAKKFVAITRIFNKSSMNFFESLGFKKCEYMHEGYDPNRYVGFEFIQDDVSTKR